MLIKPVADGFGIFDASGKQVAWCHTKEWAEKRATDIAEGRYGY